MWTTSQTSSQGANVAVTTWVDDITLVGANIIGCVHQGTANDCTTGQPSEQIGYVAIDTSVASITGLQNGFETIRGSTWTPITFTPVYVEPVVMVTQNDDNG